MHVPVLAWAETEQLFMHSQCRACQTLEHVEIGPTTMSKDDTQSYNCFTTIRQFLCFTQLRILQESVSITPCTWTTTFLWKLCQVGRTFAVYKSWVTRIFIHLLSHSAHYSQAPFMSPLATLKALVDAGNIDIDPTAESFQHTSLQTFQVGASPVADADAVARIIFSMLPCVE
ncbi:uncharacterized protein EDB91DRAFT_184781 [Suillus paluster]|uniref:uncharacterized protein n=1 Tax=Suillus paluster TaxID=48578 RepID=UPI001B86C6D5|nr:uncharacterized protein EDB91DRAFT_184781 [Suillus paluster]KAG1723074.1 hypothetical protein EDB91DRAFT_184781 [Suillus paluster]